MIGTASLTERLTQRIQSEGPITFAEFMRSALYDPEGGYYCRNDIERWGREGDYRTSPERSELFAATFARYFARLHEELGGPARWTILEAGAGSGHFAHGVLQTLASHLPKVFAATRYVIDEVSGSAQSRCRERVKAFAGRVEFAPVGRVNLEPGVIFSNELLDAFPVHRVTRQGSELKEFFVDVDVNGNFVWILDSPSTTRLQAHVDLCATVVNEGQIVEISLELENWIATIAGSLKEGFVVSVDYGARAADLLASSPDHPRFAGTLRGFRKHAFVDDVLANPGAQDLTATVNWTAVEKLGELHQLRVIDFKPQDGFLIDAGLLDQLEIESRNAIGDADRLRLSTTAREMILPDGMAAKFQVMIQRKGVV
ncbi:MAG TPA: SAM-dependent methyltransferase [Pyrinomonadaceae bacterium]|nr:SAM-dependent methyltransferase [Pyrinomonadaceae bacterium]